MRAGIALGSNLGDRLENLRAAVAELRLLNQTGEPMRISRVYETVPVDCAPGDPLFLNAVVEIGATLSPLGLFSALQELEIRAGRPPEHAPNSPRPLDLDFLYMDGFLLHSPHLTLPHPRIGERRFVLAPLCDICPDLRLLGWPGTAAEMLARLPAEPRATMLPDFL